jgi:hypothetical protein
MTDIILYAGVEENGNCMRMPVIEMEGNSDDQGPRERVLDDKNTFSDRLMAREKADGARQRDTARSLNGVETRPCMGNLTCRDNTCRPPNSKDVRRETTEMHVLSFYSLRYATFPLVIK